MNPTSHREAHGIWSPPAGLGAGERAFMIIRIYNGTKGGRSANLSLIPTNCHFYSIFCAPTPVNRSVQSLTNQPAKDEQTPSLHHVEHHRNELPGAGAFAARHRKLRRPLHGLLLIPEPARRAEPSQRQAVPGRQLVQDGRPRRPEHQRAVPLVPKPPELCRERPARLRPRRRRRAQRWQPQDPLRRAERPVRLPRPPRRRPDVHGRQPEPRTPCRLFWHHRHHAGPRRLRRFPRQGLLAGKPVRHGRKFKSAAT